MSRAQRFLELYASLAEEENAVISITIGTCRSYTEAAEVSIYFDGNKITTATAVDDYSQYPGGAVYGPILGSRAGIEEVATAMGIEVNRFDKNHQNDWYEKAWKRFPQWVSATWCENHRAQSGYIVPAFGNYNPALIIEGFEHRPLFITGEMSGLIRETSRGYFPCGELFNKLVVVDKR